MSKDVEFKGTTPEQEAAFMRGMGGESYPCKPDIFEASYELVTESDS